MEPMTACGYLPRDTVHFTGFLSESMLSLAAIPVGLPHHQAKFMTYTVWSIRWKLCAVDRKCLGMLEAQRQKS